MQIFRSIEMITLDKNHVVLPDQGQEQALLDQADHRIKEALDRKKGKVT